MEDSICFKHFGVKNGFLLLPLIVAGIGIVGGVIALTTEDHRPIPKKQEFGYSFDKVELDSIINQFPELLWLSGAEEGAKCLGNFSCGVFKHFGKESTPFDRAIKGIKAVDLFVRGTYPDYLESVFRMQKENRLSWDEFLFAQDQIDFVTDQLPQFSQQQLLEVIKLAVILSEMKNSKVLKSKAWVYEISEKEERKLLARVINTHPELFPTYSRLNLQQKELASKLLLSISLDRLFLFSSVYPLMEEIHKQQLIAKDRPLFELILFLHQCRMSGREIDSDYAVTTGFDRTLFKHHQLFREANLIAADSSLSEGYQHYLANRSRWLGFGNFTPLDRTLTFIGGMLNCYSKMEGDLIKEAFLSLDPDDISFLVDTADYLSTNGDATYRYLSMMLINLRKNPKLGRSSSERLVNAIHLGFPFVSKMVFMAQSEKKPGEEGLNFFELSNAVKVDPLILKQTNVAIGSDGVVHIKSH